MNQIVGVDLSGSEPQVGHMSYALYRPVVESASERPQLWRLIAGLVTVFVFAIVWTAGTLLLAADAAVILLYGAEETPFATAVFLSTIAGGFGLGTWLAARIWQKRGLGSLIGRGPRVLRDFVTAMLITWAVAGLAWAIILPFSEPLTPNLPFADWIKWLPVALVLILLQTGAEEVLFRGYLQSQLAARFRATWVWLLVPSVLFGALHFLPSDTVGPGLIYVASTTLFGVIAADLTARTGSIGAAWGLHFANNCIAILVVVYLGAASGLGLYSAGTLEDALQLSPQLLLDLAVLVALWLIIRRLVTR